MKFGSGRMLSVNSQFVSGLIIRHCLSKVPRRSIVTVYELGFLRWTLFTIVPIRTGALGDKVSSMAEVQAAACLFLPIRINHQLHESDQTVDAHER